MKGPKYIEDERREFALYTLEKRAIPHAADGLKNAARRVLWVGRNGKHYKTATLAGNTMPIHPHDAPVGAINTLAAHYGNNVHLIRGDGSFGTILDPTAYGEARYTSAEISDFTKDVMFRDIEIIPMRPNYDDTLEEPAHFLPLIPMAAVNGQQGIAIGFRSCILPRALDQIIDSQIKYLEGKDFSEPLPYNAPNDCWAFDWEDGNEGTKFWFAGEVEILSGTMVRVTKLPFGLSHEAYVEGKFTKEGTLKTLGILDRLIQDDIIKTYDDNSANEIDITIKFKRGKQPKDTDELLETLGLIVGVTEIFTLIDFDGETVWRPTVEEYIQKFTDWRLGWYKVRYERLKGLIEIDIQKYRDILTAIEHDVGGKSRSIKSRSALKDFLDKIGVVHLNYIADLPVYRFTKEEKKKVEDKLRAAEKTLAWYNKLLRSPKERRKVYIHELEQVLEQFKKGQYKVEP